MQHALESIEHLLLPVGLSTVVIILLGAIGVLVLGKTRNVPAKPRPWFINVAYLFFSGIVAGLAASSFGSILQQGSMSEYALQAHVALGGAFVFLLLFIAWVYLPSGIGEGEFMRWRGERWSAWLLVISGLIVAGTMLFSMLPALNTSELIQMIGVHRLAGLATIVAISLHSCALLVSRSGYR